MSSEDRKTLRTMANVLNGKCLLKTVLTITFVTMMTIESMEVIIQYRNHPTTTKSRFVSSSSISMPFIKICPSDWISRSRFQSWNISQALLDYKNSAFTGFIMVNEHEPLSETEKDTLDAEYAQMLEDHPEFDYVRFYNDIAFEPDKVVDRCRVGGQHLNCSEFMRTLLTQNGLCILLDPTSLPNQSIQGPEGGLFFRVNGHVNDSLQLMRHTSLHEGIYVVPDFAPATIVAQPIMIPAGLDAFLRVRFLNLIRSSDKAECIRATKHEHSYQ